jgi:PAS domain-containing protein
MRRAGSWPWMTPYALALELTLILAAWLAIGAWQRDRHVPGRLTFAGAALAVALWCAGELIEARADAFLVGRRVRMLGVLTIAPLWFGVAAHAVRLDLVRRTPWIPLALLTPVVPLYALLFMGPWSLLFVPAVEAEQVRVGPLLWWFLGYAWLLVTVGLALVVRGALRAEDPALRRERLAMAAGVLVPMTGNAVAVWSLARTGHTGLDLTAPLMTFTLIAFRRSILSGGVLDVLPLAQRDIIQHLPFGVVLADGQGTVLDLNPAAEDLLEVTRMEATGRALEAVIARAPLEVRIEVSTVRGRGGETARFALIEAPKAPDGLSPPGAGGSTPSPP